MDFLKKIGDAAKIGGKATLGVLGAANPALRGFGLGAYGAYKGVTNFVNNKKPQTNQSNFLNSLSSLASSAAKQGIDSGQQAASLNKPFEQTNSTFERTSYTTPQYNYGNTGNSGDNFKPDIQGMTADFFGKSYTPYTDSGSQSESQNTTPAANPYNDRLKALQDKLAGLNDGLMGYLKPGDEERNTQAQLDALQGKFKNVEASKGLGLANIADQPIAMDFITGQSRSLERRAEAKKAGLAAEAEPLTTRLARLQADRQQGFDAAKFQIGNAQTELERLQKESNPFEVGGNLVRMNPATGQYETIFKAPNKDAEGFTLGEGQMRYDAKGNLIASGAPKSSAEQLTNDIKEYNFARQQGYTGSFTDFKNSNAGGGSLPAAYREFQLTQSDPAFAQYLKGGTAGGTGRPLSDTQAKLISEGNQIGLSLQPLYGLIQNQSNLFGPLAGRAGSLNPLNTAAQTAKAQLKTAAQLVGGYLEGGKLTDQDVPKYEAMLPQLSDTPAVAKNKLDAISNLIKQKQQSYLQDFSSAGFNTSGFNGGSQINPQEIQQLKSAGYSDQQIQQFMQQRGFNSDLSKSQNYSNTDVRGIKDFSRVNTIMGSGVATGITSGSSAWKYGLDFVVDGGKGAPVKAPFGGKVVFAGPKGGFGNSVRIELDNGDQIWLSHLDSMNVKPGQRINPGMVIGAQGNTGTVLTSSGKPASASERASGRGTHVDITMRKPDGSYYSSQQVASILGARKA